MSTREVQILFDECIPRLIPDRLVEFLGPDRLRGITLSYLLDIVTAGTFDEDWIPGIRDQGWTIISADGGRKPNKNRGRKLPDLCAEYGITLVLLSPRVHSRKAIDKTKTIFSVWDQIVRIAADASSGKRYALEPLNLENLEVGRMLEKPIRKRLDPPETS